MQCNIKEALKLEREVNTIVVLDRRKFKREIARDNPSPGLMTIHKLIKKCLF